MAISTVQIANMALSHIGAKSSIEALTEPSAEANACKLWYPLALQQALEGYDWSFARKRLNLALDNDDPPDEWTYRYQYPADCVRARRIWNPLGDQADAIPFEIELNSADTRTILTDMEDANLVYTKLVTNTTAYTAMFIEALSRSLAFHIAFTLTGQRDFKKDQADGFNNIIRAASAGNANERVGKPPREAEWIRARNLDPRFTS